MTKNDKDRKINKNRIFFDAFLEKLSIDMNMHTDPDLVNDIISNDMYISDFEPFTRKMGEKLLTPQPLTNLLRQIRESIITKHPAICEFIEVAISDNLIPKSNPEYVIRTIHHTYVLEHLLQLMIKDYKFMIGLYEHLIVKRNEFGIRTGFVSSAIDVYKISGGLFQVAKTKTLDHSFKRYILLRTKGRVNKKEASGRRKALFLNILEAVLADFLRGCKDNSLSGAVLAAIPIKNVSVSGEKRLIKIELSQEWVSLYATWNLAFITSYLDSLNILYPKLIVPSVLNAKPEDYIFFRGMGLWLSINFGLFKLAKKDLPPKLLNKRVIGKKWGKININYAKELYEKEKSCELNGFLSFFNLKSTRR